MPVTALEDKNIRSFMRILGLRFESVKRAIDLRKGMVDLAKGWKWIRTSEHSDKRLLADLTKWLHSDEASTPDNDNKVEYKILVNDDHGVVCFELHPRRYYNDKISVLHELFLTTSTFEKMRASYLQEEEQKLKAKATKSAKAKLTPGDRLDESQIQAEIEAMRSNLKSIQAGRIALQKLRKAGFTRGPTTAEVEAEYAAASEFPEYLLGKRQFQSALCNCIVNRKGGECDCPLCSYITHNLTAFRRYLFLWHAGPEPKCSCDCMDPGSSFREALADVHKLTEFLLCSRVEVPELTRAHAKKNFWTYGQACLNSACSAPVLGRSCGWDAKKPSCPMFQSNDRFVWKRFENQLSGINRETGEPFYRTELVPHGGMISEFVAEFIGQYKLWLPHFHRNRLIKHNKRRLNDFVQRTELEKSTTLQSVSDYASQPSVPREFTPTCQYKQKVNNCVMLLSFKPHVVTVNLPKRGKAEARSYSGVRNECIVVYGLFDPDSKPSAHQYNMQRLDAEFYLKHGFVVYGEWFVNKKRVPRYKLRAPSDEDETDAEPVERAAREEATLTKRVLIYFTNYDDYFAGIVDNYDAEKTEACYYHVVFDDGDEADYSWRQIMLGVRWHTSNGYVPAPHEEELPTGCIGGEGSSEWSLSDETELKPRMPDIKDHYEGTDGCGGQFQGETNYGLVARGAIGPTRVRRHSIIDEANHGKNVSDPAGGQFQARLNESVKENHTIYPGTRNLVAYMAEYHSAPSAGVEQQKPATWSPDTKVYAYYSKKVLNKPKERFVPYKNSKRFHSRHGVCTNRSRAEDFGPIVMTESFCACDMCVSLKFEQCLAKKHVGHVQRVEVRRKKGTRGVVTQSEALPAFVLNVHKHQFWAVTAAEDERAAEGEYWLARILDEPYQNSAEFMYAGERFETGYYVARIHWLRCVRRGVTRAYKEERTEKYLSMNAIIRTDGPIKLTKPPLERARKGEFDLGSDEQTRIFNAS